MRATLFLFTLPIGLAVGCAPAAPGGGDAREGFGYSRGVVVNHWLGSVSKDSTSR
jgi:hypothetical protein